MKECRKCKETKDSDSFGKLKTSKDGLQPKCRSCVAEYDIIRYARNKDKAKERAKAYRLANPGMVRAARLKYYKSHPEGQKSRTLKWKATKPDSFRESRNKGVKKYYEANREKVAARSRRYRQANPEMHREWFRAWQKKNPALCELRRIIRRAERGDRSALEVYGLTSVEMLEEIHREKLAIYNSYFGGQKHHADHMNPLAGAKGDRDEMLYRSHFTNIAYIPEKENQSKGAKPFKEWLDEIGDGDLKDCVIEQREYNQKINNIMQSSCNEKVI